MIAAAAGGILLAAIVVFFLMNKGGLGNMVLNQNDGANDKAASSSQSPVQANENNGVGVQTTPAPVDEPAEGVAVKVNQVGYLASSIKKAIISGDAEGPFRLVSEESGETLYTGTLSLAVQDSAAGETVRQADFSDFAQPGVYRLEADGAGRSYPFEIAEQLYGSELTLMLRSYTLQRSGVEIDDPLSGVKVSAGHFQDREAVLAFDDGITKQGEMIDAFGGWYDAGDFGKYISPAAVTVGQLLLSFELNPGSYPEGQMSFPEGLESNQQGVPDLLSEVRFELDWMLKMQRADGAVYHKMSGASWPGFVMPHTDTQTRYIYGLSTFTTAQFAGATAQAARIYKPYDEAYAAKLLEAAERAQRYLDENPAFSFRKDKGQDDGSGGYGKNSDREERLWAAAELYRTTGDAAYKETAHQYRDLLEKPSVPVTWMDAGLLGQWAYYHAEGSDPLLKDGIAVAIAQSADAAVARSAADGYLTALKLQDYHWASAKLAAAYGCLLLLANELKPSPDYVHAALEHLHYLFGRTATGYTYITAVGEKYPKYPHHRTGDASGVLFPGLVVGGPNKTGGDPDLDAVKAELPPAKAYLDVLGSYSSNEYAIDYNAPVVMLAAYFADPER